MAKTLNQVIVYNCKTESCEQIFFNCKKNILT